MTPVPDAEYEALTSGCGFVPWKQWSVVTLTGDDRHTFLQNMCTNDVKKLTPGQGCEAFCTDVKGKILAHVFVLKDVEKTYLLTVPEQADDIIGHLDRYIIREDVQLVDDSENFAVFLIAGNVCTELLKQLAPVEGGVLRVEFPLAGRNSYLVLIDSAAAHSFVDSLEQAGATACGFAAWNTLRIEAGLPLYGIDFNSDHLPQEIARDDQAISFTKGCYLGQETVARLDALGHVNKQLVTVKFTSDTVPEPPIPLTFQDKPVGEATSVTASPMLGAPIGIAMLRREASAVGTVLDSPAGPAEVVTRPVVG